MIEILNDSEVAKDDRKLGQFMNCLFLTMFLIMGFTSISFSHKQLLRLDNEASEESKIGKFLYNHKLYVYICILIWVSFLSSSYYTLKVDSSAPNSLQLEEMTNN